MLPRFLRRLAETAFCAAALWSVVNPASAQEIPLPPAPVPATQEQQDLKTRVERLEKQNQELLKALQELRNSSPRARSPENAEADVGVSPDQVTRIVSDYLQAQEDKKKKDDAKKSAWHEVGSDLNMKSTWRNGFFSETPQKDFKFHIRGRAQNDWSWFAPDQNLEPRGWSDGAYFRRLRLGADGTAWEVINWQVDVDFAGSSSKVKDTFMEITQLPYVGNFRAGHFYEPFTLEGWGTSDNWVTFIERAPVIDALDPERNIGMVLYNTAFDERMFWALGFFRPNSTEGDGTAEDSGDGEYAYTARLTFNPIYEADGRTWLHLGGAYSYRSLIPVATGTINNPAGDNPRFRSRIPLRAPGTTFVNFERVVDTGIILADHIQLYNLQAAMALGPLSLQAEVLAAQVDEWVRGPQLRNPSFWGCYVFASFFLTGEHRPYIRRTAAIGYPIPNERFFLVRRGEGGDVRPLFGRGAWELTARYGFLDLGSPAINQIGSGPTAIPPTSAFQGHLHDVTLGLNWYLNPNFRVMFNYVFAHVNGLGISPTTSDGDVHGVGIRFSFFF